jgi:hypothetical protein
MARSYFNRVLQGAAQMKGALAPPRPVSNLWKSARLDWMAGEAAADLPSLTGLLDSGRRGRVGASAIEPAVVPAAGIEPESRGDARVGSSRHGESVGRELVQENAVPKAEVRARSKASLQANAGEPGSQMSRTPRINDATRKYNSRKGEAGMLPNVEPVRGHQSDFGQQEESMRSRVRRSDLGPHPKPTVAGDRDRTLEPSEHSRVARARSEITRSSEVWNAAARDESSASEKNAVHIGKIEVQVVSPPAPARHTAAPAPPKGRLARGYALWSNGW